ncbi:hypothetical protein [Leifsonia shinshuensis]|uniref:hypothetical protein n=1 Tax=Leifsonia shinshuensis TaxID=150026 RepID=UPI0028577814|nr:hypothetical protein [Leifsonia shinshuensis]MDR6971068.1 hypothetical protein [Leifsonia shinshuensis]
MEFDRLSGAATDSDPQMLLLELIDSVVRSLPADVASRALLVERTRSLSDWMAQRPGPITRLRLSGPTEALSLEWEPGPRWTATVEQLHGTVSLSSRTVPVSQWLTAFAQLVTALAVSAAEDAADSERALQALGILAPGSEVRVDDANLSRDLLTLAARVRRRVPAEAAEAVERIGALLADTLPRVAGTGEPEVIVRVAATVYLPDTLRAYLALPAGWAAEHTLAGGLTPAQALIAQLDALESAARTMRDAAVERDASALLANGRFLADRFAGSRRELDLP